MSAWLSHRLLRSQSDERLAALTAEGHDRAFTVLVERYQIPLLAFVRARGADGRAEDVVQQALMQAWIALRAGTQVDHVRGWLHQIARRATWRAAAAAAGDELSPAPTAGADTEEKVERRLEIRRLLAEIERLPQRQRDALIQTALQGHSAHEVAGSLGLSENALRQLLFRARTTLRAAADAVVPFPIVAWAARGASSSTLRERVTQLVGSGGGTAGLTKAAVIIAAAATASGGVTARHHFDGARHTSHASMPEPPVASVHPSTAPRIPPIAAAPTDRGDSLPASRRERAHGRRRALPTRTAPPTRTALPTESTAWRSGGRDDSTTTSTPSKQGATGHAPDTTDTVTAGDDRERTDEPTVTSDDTADTATPAPEASPAIPSTEQTSPESAEGPTDPPPADDATPSPEPTQQPDD